MGKGSHWRRGHNSNVISENFAKIKKTKDFSKDKEVKKVGEKITYKY